MTEQNAINDPLWRLALLKNTVSAYQDYLKKCADDSPYIDEAHWLIAKVSNTQEAYEQYLENISQNPVDSQHIEDALNAIQKIIEEAPVAVEEPVANNQQNIIQTPIIEQNQEPEQVFQQNTIPEQEQVFQQYPEFEQNEVKQALSGSTQNTKPQQNNTVIYIIVGILALLFIGGIAGAGWWFVGYYKQTYGVDLLESSENKSQLEDKVEDPYPIVNNQENEQDQEWQKKWEY